MIDDRVAAILEETPDLEPNDAEQQAVGSLGSVERLAEELGGAPLTISLAVRRTFVRALAALFAGHLLLSIVLTVAGSETPVIAGILAPLPTGPFMSVLMAVITIFLIDTGALLVLFVAVGSRTTVPSFPGLDLQNRWTRKDAIQGLLLVILLAVIFNFLLDSIFSIKQGKEWVPFLAPEAKALVPYINVVLGFLALRHILTLTGRGASAGAVACDALATLAGRRASS